MENVENSRTWLDDFGDDAEQIKKWLQEFGLTITDCDQTPLTYYSENMPLDNYSKYWDFVTYRKGDGNNTFSIEKKSGSIYCRFHIPGSIDDRYVTVEYQEEESLKEEKRRLEVKMSHGSKIYMSHALVITRDLYGNILIACDLSECIEIEAGDSLKSAKEYLEEMKQEAKERIKEHRERELVELMYDDSRIARALTTFINEMPKDAISGFDMAVDKVVNRYVTEVRKAINDVGGEYIPVFEEIKEAKKKYAEFQKTFIKANDEINND